MDVRAHFGGQGVAVQGCSLRADRHALQATNTPASNGGNALRLLSASVSRMGQGIVPAGDRPFARYEPPQTRGITEGGRAAVDGGISQREEPTKAVDEGHLAKGVQQLDGDVARVNVHGHNRAHIRQLAAVDPLHRQHPLPRQLHTKHHPLSR